MSNANTFDQIREYFESVVSVLEEEDTGHELYYSVVSVDGSYLLTTFWCGRDWSRVMNVFLIPHGTDLSQDLHGLDVHDYLTYPLKPFERWQIKTVL